MNTFYCDSCGSLLFFENVQCLNCGHFLGFLPDLMRLSSLEAAGGGQHQPVTSAANGRLYRKCSNGQQHQICNWMIPAEDNDPFCVSCRLNLVIPDLGVEGNLKRWHKLEQAKRRVLYTLYQLGLPTEGNAAEKRLPLRFKFLSDGPNGEVVLTGHNQGEITINIAEADDDERERRRVGLNEPYRTLVGHLRHEVAHYYWDLLIANGPRLDEFHRIFGDETQDYNASLKAYYQQGPPADWHKRYVSAYACSHPWEDWAETWAHYLHMVDTLETAANFGLTMQFQGFDKTVIRSDPSKAMNRDAPFDEVLRSWIPLTTAVNSLNRAMGLPDLYPFILLDNVVEKMRFIHDLIRTPIPVAPQPTPKPAQASSPELAAGLSTLVPAIQ